MCDACCSSTEHAVQKPATTGWTFTEQPETDTEHGVLPEPCAQAVEQPRGRFRIRTLAALEEPGIAQRQRQQHAGTQTQRTDRRRQPLPCEPLGDQSGEMRRI